MPIGGEGPDEPQHLEVIKEIVQDKQLPIFSADDITFIPGLLSGAYYPMSYNSPFNYLFFLPVAMSKSLNFGTKSVLNYRVISSVLLALFSAVTFLSLIKIKPQNLLAAITTTVFISLIPQVIFSGSYLNIEPVSLLFSALNFYLLINFFEKNDYRSSLLLGVALGFLALCKANYLVWFAVVFVLAFYKNIKNKASIRDKIIRIGLIILPILLINLYWWIRNYQLYGDPLIVNYIGAQIRRVAPDWFSPPALSGYNMFSILFEANFIRYTYLGFFAALGGAFIFLPLGLYYLFYALLFFPVITALYLSYRRRERRFNITFLFLTIWVFLLYFAHKNLYDFSPQGRHLFPLLPAFSWLIYLGLSAFKKKIIFLAYTLFSVVSALYAFWLMTDRFYVKGTGYVIASNFGNYLGDFSWRSLNYHSLKQLVDYILYNNPPQFTIVPVIIYFAIFLLLSLLLIWHIIRSRNDQNY